MKKILITGGAGFIGSHLCKSFIEEGDFVVCVDNFITGSERNIKDLLNVDKLKFITQDIAESFYIDGNFDWILHFASIASPLYYIKFPIKTLKSGLLGTYNCLGMAKEKNAKFMLASTSEIYGDPLVHPQPEEYWGNVNSIGMRSCYDESKRGAEALSYAYMRQHKVEVRVARIFNTYGPHMQFNDGRVVSNFIVQALKGEPLTIYGEGEQTRAFCYVDDLIEGIKSLMKVEYGFPVNLGNPIEHKIIDLARMVIELTGSSSQMEFRSLPQDDPQKRRPDISKAKQLLRWKPRVSIREGLKQTIAWFEEKMVEDKLLAGSSSE